MTPRRSRAALTGLAALLGTLAILVPVALALPAQAAASRVWVVQALSGPALDVTIGGRTLAGVGAGQVREAGALPPGSVPVEVRRGGTVLVRDTVTVSAGTSTSLIVHAASTPNGPRVAVGLSDAPRDAPPAGSGRMAVLYVGASGPIDVRVGGARAAPLSGLVTGGGAQGDMTPGDHSVAVTRAGSGEVLLAPQRVSLRAGATTNVYVFGAVEGGALSLTTQLFAPAAVGGAPAGTPGSVSGSAPDAGPTLRAGSGGPGAGTPVDGPIGQGPADADADADSGTGPGAPAAGPPAGSAGGAEASHVTLPAGTQLLSLKGGRSPFEDWVAAPPAAEPSADGSPAATIDIDESRLAPARLALILLLAAAAGASVWALWRRRAGTGSPAAP